MQQKPKNIKGLFFSKFITIYFWGVILLAGCAIVRPPEGGPKDETGPKIAATYPEMGQKQVNSLPIKISFDEYIDPNVSPNDLIINPLPKNRPTIFVQGKSLFIKLNEDLLPNTTYSLILKPSIKDFRERNPLKKPFHLAFSTGETLDTASISGKVSDAASLKPEPTCLVALFPAETVPDSNFIDIKPKYLTLTDSTGYFNLKHIASGTYLLAAFTDTDFSNSYNNNSEKIGLTENCIIKISVNSEVSYLQIFTQIWDTLPPSVSKVKWLGKTAIEVLFSEGLLNYPVVQSPKTAFSSTWITQAGKAIQIFLPPENQQDSIILTQITDSVKNTTSRTIFLPVTLPPDTFWLEQKPHPQKLETWLLRANENIPPDSFTTHLTCIDTAGKKVVVQAEMNKGIVEWTHPKNLNPESQLKLLLSPFNYPKIKIDSIKTVYCFPRYANDFGSLSGQIDIKGNIIVYLFKEGNTVPIAIQTDKNFTFNLLEPGNYFLSVVFDEDNNGIRTMGRLKPYRLPEKIWKWNEPIVVKANWETNVSSLKPEF